MQRPEQTGSVRRIVSSLELKECGHMPVTDKTTIHMAKFFRWLGSGCALLLASCQLTEEPPTLEGRAQVVCMEKTPVFFAPDAQWDSLKAVDGWERLDNGRFLTQTFAVPPYQVRPTITARVTLRSAGDPWDKSGSLMLIPQSAPNLLDVGFAPDSSLLDYPWIALNERESDYVPPIELLRFITPFGVGHFSDSERLDEYRPVYIPRWEDSVHWEADISHLWEALSDSMTLGVYIDTWTKEGYALDVNLAFEGQPATVLRTPSMATLPLINTSKFGSEQRPFDGFAHGGLSVEFELVEPGHNAVLYYTPTGHGGHAEGDEFVRCEHRVIFDGDTCRTFTPWRDDCASFRRFNPTSGVWMERTFWRGDSLDERIASSDYSRSGWCPGSDVPPVIIPLGDLAAGSHELRVEVPTAQPFTAEEMNFWNVAAYLTFERSDGR